MKPDPKRLKRQQVQLDEVLQKLRPLAKLHRLKSGWIKAVREGLGMTSAQLARRLAIAQPTVIRLEQSEQHKTITLGSLERAAQAMGCRLVYALVPDGSLKEQVAIQALKTARRQVARVQHSMALEQQEAGGVADERQIQERAQDLAASLRSQIWEDES